MRTRPLLHSLLVSPVDYNPRVHALRQLFMHTHAHGRQIPSMVTHAPRGCHHPTAESLDRARLSRPRASYKDDPP